MLCWLSLSVQGPSVSLPALFESVEAGDPLIRFPGFLRIIWIMLLDEQDDNGRLYEYVDEHKKNIFEPLDRVNCPLDVEFSCSREHSRKEIWNLSLDRSVTAQ